MGSVLALWMICSVNWLGKTPSLFEFMREFQIVSHIVSSMKISMKGSKGLLNIYAQNLTSYILFVAWAVISHMFPFPLA